MTLIIARSALCHLPANSGIRSLKLGTRRHASTLKKVPPARLARTLLSTALATAATYSLYGSFTKTDRTEAPETEKDELSEPLGWQGKVIPTTNLQAASKLLRQYESSRAGPNGVGRTYRVQVPSNSPIEDHDHIVIKDDPLDESTIEDGVPRGCWAIYDGHVGPACSYLLRRTLVHRVMRDIIQLCKPSQEDTSVPSSSPEEIDDTIKATFLRLDREIIQEGVDALTKARLLTDVLSMTAPSYAGSCALLALYTPSQNLLRVACVGDSRAVLGRRNQDGTYSTIPMSIDQTGYNQDEVNRIHTEHPNEPDVIKKGRVAGMAITRAFGDGPWKWPKAVARELEEKFFGTVRTGVETPPYLTAEPVITTTKIQPDNDFLIMASDGLWDHMTSEQAVDLVARWLKRRPQNNKTLNGPVAHFDDESRDDSIPLTKRATIYDPRKTILEKDFVVEDANPATHLVRNAFGGSDRERFCGIMGAKPPLARDLRDDTTVHVIFFGNGDGPGKERN